MNRLKKVGLLSLTCASARQLTIGEINDLLFFISMIITILGMIQEYIESKKRAKFDKQIIEEIKNDTSNA